MYKAIIFDFFGVIYSGHSVDTGVVQLITELRGRYKVGLLSNSSAGYVPDILEEHGLAGLFDGVVVSGEVGVTKPDPEIFGYILEKLGIKPAEAVFTDDGPHNVAAAESVGIHSIVFTGEKALRQELAAAGVKVS